MIDKDLKDFLKLFKEFAILAKFVTRIRTASDARYFSADLLVSRKERVRYDKLSIPIGRLVKRIHSHNNEKYNRITFLLLSTLFSTKYCHVNDSQYVLYQLYSNLYMKYGYQKISEILEKNMSDAINLIEVIESIDTERRNKFVYFLMTF